MIPTWPRYLLFTETIQSGRSLSQRSPGWRFMLHDIDSQQTVSASDFEPNVCGERLELMAAVRGLEALDGPSQVTLVTASNYVRRGIARGLKQWKANNWKWERFGRVVTVKDCDLWQRIDQALEFHQITSRGWRFNLVADAGVPKTSLSSRRSAAERRSAAGRPASQSTRQMRPLAGQPSPEEAVGHVLDGATSEPALLIVRTRGRSAAVRLNDDESTPTAAKDSDQLAFAG